MTGKVKEMFEKWYCSMMYPLTFLDGGLVRFEKFYDLPIVHRQGVYLQFFRENGIFISVDECEGTVIFKARYTGNRYNGCLFTVKDSSYNTAFTQAIETACNILEGK